MLPSKTTKQTWLCLTTPEKTMTSPPRLPQFPRHQSPPNFLFHFNKTKGPKKMENKKHRH